MGDVGAASLKLDNRLGGAHLSTGRLKQEFVSLTRQLTGVPTVVWQLASSLSEFVVGGAVTIGVLGGVAAIAAIYGKLTEASRKAREESDKLTKSLVDQARSQHLATLQGLEDLKLEAEINLQRVKREPGVGARSFLETLLRGGLPTVNAQDAEEQSKRIADAELAVTQATKNWTDAWADANKPVKEHTVSVKALGDAVKNTAGNLAAALQVVREWGPMIAALNRGASAGAIANLQQSVIGTFKMPDIAMPFEGLDEKQKDQLRQLGILTDHEDKNSMMLREAIWGSAAALANTVVSALNIGGGGKGSSFGGAFGGTAGFAAGFALGGPVGGAIGSTLGNVIGSALGGLFDHKRSIDNNTAAVKANTQALLLYAPQGFSVANARINAQRALRTLGDAARSNASRGGVPVLTVGT